MCEFVKPNFGKLNFPMSFTIHLNKTETIEVPAYVIFDQQAMVNLMENIPEKLKKHVMCPCVWD